jgi:aspartate kinase
MTNEQASVRAIPFARAVSDPHAPLRSEHVHVHRNLRRSLRVMKFGGTSVGNALCIRNVAEIIQRGARENELVVVVSAMSGVTKRLIEAAMAAEANNRERFTAILGELRQQHESTIEILIHSQMERDHLRRKIRSLLAECQQWCEETAACGELNSRMKDVISSLGERLSAPILAAALERYGLVGESIEATDLIVTDDFHGAAEPKMALTRERCDNRLRPLLLKGIVPVVTGFIGATEEGALTTLGRGGSDYSASIVGAALKAQEVIIWTDVDGILTADPRLVPSAVTIPQISYREASELAHYGAKVLHPKTLRPVMEDGIPVWIRNTFAPGKRGTKVTPIGNTNRGGVKALTATAEAALLRLAAPLANASDAIARILDSAKRVRVDILMISRSPSRDDLLVVVAKAVAPRLADALGHEFSTELKSAAVDLLKINSEISIVTVVGENLDVVKQVVAQATELLKQDKVQIVAIGQGSSACNISFVVASKDLNAALAITHNEFGTDPRALQQSSFHGLLPSVSSRQTRSGLETVGAVRAQVTSSAASAAKVLDESTFRMMIAQERRRTERSRKPALLTLLDVGDCLSRDKSGNVMNNILAALSLSTRETDITGWYEDKSIIGLMFTELGMGDSGTILGTMMHRVSETLRKSISLEKFSQINLSFHVFPENWNQDSSAGNPKLYPDLERREKTQRGALALKRFIDIIGSAVAIVFFSPLFALIAVLVKLSSDGPIMFRQERVGQFGRPFTFMKFRSMYANNDPKIHKDFMKRVIGGDVKNGSKMENDPRITPLGRFLRKSSLDELPQFFSVLKGDMSLVGPRPPIAYECQEYDIWHRRRVLEVKPGITGLWQVTGRSRLRFDEMVRLDLLYVRTWSLWVDLKIMLKTPIAVVRGGDAF